VIEKLIEQVESRFAELEREMSDPEVIADRQLYAEVGREYSRLEPFHALAIRYRVLGDDLEGARELIEEGVGDEDLKKVVRDAPAELETLAEEIRLAMVEGDPNDDKNVIVEIRAGTGGDEAAIFAGDLFKMLTRYAVERGFSTEILSQSVAEQGGFKEVTFEVGGNGAFSVFKYEGGTHRVQRVPETESQGRIHTSTATVAPRSSWSVAACTSCAALTVRSWPTRASPTAAKAARPTWPTSMVTGCPTSAWLAPSTTSPTSSPA
jgi:peptide chain release factor 1